MAHTNLTQLQKLLGMIDDINNDIYIHIDKKSSIKISSVKTVSAKY